MDFIALMEILLRGLQSYPNINYWIEHKKLAGVEIQLVGNLSIVLSIRGTTR